MNLQIHNEVYIPGQIKYINTTISSDCIDFFYTIYYDKVEQNILKINFKEFYLGKKVYEIWDKLDKYNEIHQVFIKYKLYNFFNMHYDFYMSNNNIWSKFLQYLSNIKNNKIDTNLEKIMINELNKNAENFSTLINNYLKEFVIIYGNDSTLHIKLANDFYFNFLPNVIFQESLKYFKEDMIV